MRTVRVTLFSVLALGLLATDAQQAPRIPRIGYLAASLGTEASHLIGAFRQGLRELGYVEGQDIVVEF